LNNFAFIYRQKRLGGFDNVSIFLSLGGSLAPFSQTVKKRLALKFAKKLVGTYLYVP
jgi:hypothetical protein